MPRECGAPLLARVYAGSMKNHARFAAAATMSLLLACSSDSSSPSGGGGDGGTGSGSTSGAQIRFKYQSDWATHLGCATLASYRITFGANPVPISFSIDTAGALGAYKSVDGRPYKDADVLHIYTCNGTEKQLYARFGADLPLAAGKKYTVTLGGTAPTVAEDP
jgi:hypothetical protein